MVVTSSDLPTAVKSAQSRSLRRGGLAILSLWLGLVWWTSEAPAVAPEGPKVVVLVVDGLRPDYVTEDLMPRLHGLAEAGVRGAAHHAVFPTETRVNGPSIFTGRYPTGHGQMGNSVYLPEVAADRVLDAGKAEDLRLVDARTGGSLLTAASLAELLAAQGKVYFAASSGSTGSALLMNHRGAGAGLVHHAFTVPDSLGRIVTEALGPPPTLAAGDSGVRLVARAVDALLRVGLDRADADVLAAWLTEPDGTAHARGIGAPETLDVLRAVDSEIGRLVDGLQERGLGSSTNVLVTSDHGFASRTGSTSLHQLLVEGGLKASGSSLDVVLAGGAIHVREGGSERIEAIVRLLQSTEWIGPVFTRAASGGDLGSVPGTASFASVGWAHPRSADILTSANWSNDANAFGYPGSVSEPGVAGHGSSSPWDIHATFIATGPAIKRGVVSEVPSGNIDLTPTALFLVGARVPAGLDGRVLSEALVGGARPGDVDVSADTVIAATRVGGLDYELRVLHTRVGATTYFGGTEVRRRRAEGERP